MDEKRESFKKKLDQLIKLFRKLKDKEDVKNMPGVDPMMYQSFELFLNNYDMMKDQITDDLLNQFGDQMQYMVSSLVEQLKDQLGDDIDLEEDEQELVRDIRNEPLPKIEVQEGETEEDVLKKKLEMIDQKLKTPGLSAEEMDHLLEQRFRLSQK